MKKIKNYLPVMVACLAVFLFSCKNENKTAASNETAGTSAAPTPTTSLEVTADSIAMAQSSATKPSQMDAQSATSSQTTAQTGNKSTTTATLPNKNAKDVVSNPTPKGGNIKKRIGKDDVFVISEVQPLYPGGEAEMMKFLKKNIKYPVKAKEQGIKGTVFMSFVVEKDGSVGDVEVSKGVDPLLDVEAMRVVNSMPKWAAGKQNNKRVAVQYTLPVKFELIQ